MKVNFGGAYSSCKSGAVVIEARDHYGAVCVAKSRYLPFALDAQTVEAFALKDAVMSPWPVNFNSRFSLKVMLNSSLKL